MRRIRSVIDVMNRVSSTLLRGPLTGLLTVVAGAWLACWIPHYLLWPWWQDTEHFAMTARAWTQGIVPYRDLIDFNFPGATYTAWLIGSVFGYGVTWPTYAVDAAVLVLLGVVLAWWSRVLFTTMLPALVGSLIVLGFYLSLDNSQVAQRDWHAPLFQVLGLMVLQARPRRASRFGTALAFAAALAYRPYAVLLLPGVLWAVVVSVRSSGENDRPRTRRPLVEWALAAATFVFLAFLPLLLTGAFVPFLNILRDVHLSGAYGEERTGGVLWTRLGKALLGGRFLCSLAGCLLVARSGPARFRPHAVSWALVVCGAVGNQVLSPVPHHYLNLTILLASAVGIAFVTGVVVSSERTAAAVRLAAVLGLLLAFVHQIPRYCDPSLSVRALTCAWRGTTLEAPPPACQEGFTTGRDGGYDWGDYCRLLDFLRARTGRRTRVANLLRRMPFPSINGTIDRLSPFPTTSAPVFARFLGPRLDREFANRLHAAPDCVVVWVPDETPLTPAVTLEAVVTVVRRDYEFQTRFGKLEVWRRKPPHE